MTDGVKAQVEREGMPDGDIYHCPECGHECETIYRSCITGGIVGCENCVERLESWEAFEP